jgi:hypothetical protein
MKRRNLMVSMISFLTFGTLFAATEEPPKCQECDLELKKGDVLAPVQGEKGLYFIHFKCALKKHLRTLKG